VAIIPSASVKSMQQALSTYAQGTGFTAANPGKVDGIVGAQTVNAVIAVLPLLPGMPSEIKTLAVLGPIIFSDPSALAKAKGFVTQHSGKIRDGVIGLAAYQVITGNAPKPGITQLQPLLVTAVQPGGSYTPGISSTPWYKTWWGIGGMVLGGTLAVGTTIALVRR